MDKDSKDKAVLDTDTLSAIMRQNSSALSHTRAYLALYSQITNSIITKFEILRGLMAKKATSQTSAFHTMCESLEVLPLTDSVIVRAAEIYGRLHQTGQLIGDADILIAATCLEHSYEIVTNNTSHFSRISGLVVQNWLVA